ncbi:MAG TPA: serine hydrolase domain-containing protein, partial [Intrasporangium sp.]|nr:serine hydrolase domain-containing protein [Intrasporangium sp.]
GVSVAATDSTQFMIGSVTKTFTALAVMALRDAGRLSLDDPLDVHVPATRHGRLQLRQMLAHASGLQREPVGNIWESLSAPSVRSSSRASRRPSRSCPPTTPSTTRTSRTACSARSWSG